MISEDTLPETGQPEKFGFSMAGEAIRICTDMKPSDDYVEAYRHAKRDMKFVHKTGELVRLFDSVNTQLTGFHKAVDRLAHYRSEMRAAAMTHVAVYQLGVGTVCEQRVAALLKDNLFVYEGHWASGQTEVCFL